MTEAISCRAQRQTNALTSPRRMYVRAKTFNRHQNVEKASSEVASGF